MKWRHAISLKCAGKDVIASESLANENFDFKPYKDGTGWSNVWDWNAIFVFWYVFFCVVYFLARILNWLFL